MTDLVFRPLAPGETDLFTSMPDPDREATRTGVAWLGRDFAATMDAGHYRPQWTWVALDAAGTVKARRRLVRRAGRRRAVRDGLVRPGCTTPGTTRRPA